MTNTFRRRRTRRTSEETPPDMPPHARPYDDVLALIGWTPLIRLNRVTRGIRTPVYAKAEFFNPGGSIKDRIGMPIIERAEREGRLKPGGTIVEGTSGNTGVGLAIAAALKGYRCIFTMPDKMSQEKVRLLKAFGAEVIVTPTAVPPDHPDNYVMMAKRIAKETPNARDDSNPAARSSRGRAATPASASRSRQRSRATSASSRCPTRCRRKRFGCSRHSARRSSSRRPPCLLTILTTTS